MIKVLESPPPGVSTIYDLVANVTHESTAGTTRDKENTVWKVHVRAGKVEGSDVEKWYMIQDLIIEDIAREMLFLGETVLQVFR
jgi:U4/U6.U5 tri-snRNP-associated protein 2